MTINKNLITLRRNNMKKIIVSLAFLFAGFQNFAQADPTQLAKLRTSLKQNKEELGKTTEDCKKKTQLLKDKIEALNKKIQTEEKESPHNRSRPASSRSKPLPKWTTENKENRNSENFAKYLSPTKTPKPTVAKKSVPVTTINIPEEDLMINDDTLLLDTSRLEDTLDDTFLNESFKQYDSQGNFDLKSVRPIKRNQGQKSSEDFNDDGFTITDSDTTDSTKKSASLETILEEDEDGFEGNNAKKGINIIDDEFNISED